jgi:hypothetical protein
MPQPTEEDIRRTKPIEVHVNTPLGWSIWIKPDGSGTVGFKGYPDKSAALPAGAFDFPRVAGELAAACRAAGDDWGDATAYFFEPAKTSAYAMYLPDQSLPRALFARAFEMATGKGPAFDATVANEPILDPP